MSTRAAIIEKVGDREYRGIYLHSDGYPQHAGEMLELHYNTPEKVKELIDLGDLSCLCEKVKPDAGVTHSFNNKAPDVTVAYHRDRGEPHRKPATGCSAKQVARQIDHAFYYVFENGVWTTHKGL